jgi:histidinol phosphatase-like PHP family hydrolase
LKKNQKELKLFKGIEIDLGSSDRFIKKLISPEKFDIILFEYLETMEGLAFMERIVKSWNSETPNNYLPLIGLAHFDPSFFIYSGLDRLIQILKRYNIYFEFNSRYPDYYSPKNEIFFTKLYEQGILVAIGSDAHYRRRLKFIDEPLEMILSYNLIDNLEKLIDLLYNKKISQ